MVTYCQKAPAQEQGQSEFPDGILIQDLQASHSEVAIPQWCLSILIFKNNSIFLFLRSKSHFQNSDSTQPDQVLKSKIQPNGGCFSPRAESA